ncbi:MAG: PEP-CTERM sorting domain-containing protein [Proteobacteria bacterium]|nr:PEP-CTERM sorting domain-containing protein [Pseudomonadota bacterium]
MKFAYALFAAAAPLMLAVPAHASYVQVDFAGQVLGVNAGGPASIAAGTPITFQAVFDPSTLTDHTQSVNDGTGLGFSSVFTASLSDDPNASLTIKVGDVTFTKFDEVNYGTPEGDCGAGCDLGAGNFPTVTYLNGAFAGIGNMFINAQGYTFDADPIADAFGGFDLGDQSVGGYQFFLGKGDADNPFRTIVAVGNYDAAAAVFTPVPEPAAWSLMVAGFAALGFGLRRSRRSPIAA